MIIDGDFGYLRVGDAVDKDGHVSFIIRSPYDATGIDIEGLAELRDHLDKLLEGETA